MINIILFQHYIIYVHINIRFINVNLSANGNYSTDKNFQAFLLIRIF